MKRSLHQLVYTYFPRLWFLLRYRTENEYQNYVYSKDEIVPYGQSLRKLYALSPVLLEITRGRSFLEIGCDTGFFPLQAAALGATRSVGIDRNPKALKKAKEAAAFTGRSQVQFVEATIPNLPIAEKFDTVLFMSAMHYMFSDRCGNVILFTTMDSFIRYISQFVGKYLAIEFVDAQDSASEMLLAKSILEAGEYSQERFLSAMRTHFSEIVDLGHTHYQTRTLYLASK